MSHVCALLRRNLIGYSIRDAKLPLDKLIFPALKTSDDPDACLKSIQNRLLGSTVDSVGRHGKYFWMRFQNADHGIYQEPTVMMMHFGMTGMIKLQNIDSHMIFMENGGDKKVLKKKLMSVAVSDRIEETIKTEIIKGEVNEDLDTKSTLESEWPPRFTKFELVFELKGQPSSENHVVNFAFTDPRRLARVRFLTGPEYSTDEKLLLQEPLKSLGPDYSKKIDFEKVSKFVSGDPDPDHHGRPRLPLLEFSRLVLSRKKPIKSLLLDQDQFAGIGNWVSDEILHRAQIYPGEVISSKISDPSHEVLERLYNAIIFVMEESVRVEGNVHEFPDNWLMLYRWGKGRKDKQKTKEGYTVEYETIGGRTSCYVPALQKPLKRERDNTSQEETKKSKTVKKSKIVKKETDNSEEKTVRRSSRRGN